MKKYGKTILYLTIFGVIVAAVICVKAFLFGNFTVSGPSMEPTFVNGDVVWASKVSKPDYGDVVLIVAVEDDGPFGEEPTETNLVKRAIAFEGDKLWMEKDDSDGQTYYLCRKKKDSDVVEKLVTETYGDAVLPRFDLLIYTCTPITNDEGNVAFDEQHAYVVPEGCFYAMGDNRTISKDSRSLGAFSCDSVIGVVLIKGSGFLYAIIGGLLVVMTALLLADAMKNRNAARKAMATEADDSDRMHESDFDQYETKETDSDDGNLTKEDFNDRASVRECTTEIYNARSETEQDNNRSDQDAD